MIDIASVKTRNLFDLISPDTQLKGGPKEYAGPCPRCGGTDRFHVHTDKGWFCRTCTGEPDGTSGHWRDALDYIMWRDNCDFLTAYNRLGGTTTTTPEERAHMQAEREQAERDRRQQEQAARDTKRAELHQAGAWMEYYRNLDKYGVRGMWEERGLSPMWQDYFQVGYCPDKEFMYDAKPFTSASLTIPYFKTTLQAGEPSIIWQCTGLVHRLLLPGAPGGKYRPHSAGLGKSLFHCDLYSENIGADVLLVEGEIKAMVTWARIQDTVTVGPGAPCRSILHRLHVVGAAGKGFKREWAAEFSQAERIWICLDPDAEQEAEATAHLLGTERCKIISLSDKIDDMLLSGALHVEDIAGLMETARRVR